MQQATNDLFVRRWESFKSFGDLTALNLAMVAEALDTVADLRRQNVGGETVEKRIGEYKSWDPEIFKVDKDTESGYIRRLKQLGHPVVLLSEEVGRLELNTDKPGDRMYVASDPFDGSYLFKRGIPDFWYSSVAFYDARFNPLCCAVGDAVQGVIAHADSSGAYVAELRGDRLAHRVKLDPAYRRLMGRKPAAELAEASIESYAMKPKKFLLPLVARFGELLEPFKFFLPNGGPYGFVDVAEGKIDVYFAMRQPFVDVFSGIYVAQQAGVMVTDFDGKPVRREDNSKGLYDVVVSSTPELHEKVLAKIAACRAKGN